MSTLRILNLEDDPRDARLIHDSLTSDGLTCDITVVTTRGDFVAALEGGCDVVLADYKVPGFDGLEALDVACERRAEIPFIFVTGALGEERAIDALKRGATDYVMKDRIARLAPAVRRAVAEAEERMLLRRADEALRQSEATFSELIERAPFGIYVVDSQLRIAHMNASSRQGTFRNVRPVIGHDLTDAMRILWPEPVAAEIVGHFRGTLDTGEPCYSRRFVHPRRDLGTVESYEWELHRMTMPGGQHGVICYSFDSTKLREAETALRESQERLARAEKMEAIGLLAGGIAHDFNNLLVGVIGNASLAREMLPPDSDVLPLMNRIVKAGEQAADLTSQLLHYAGKGQVAKEALDLSRLVQDGTDLLGSTISGKISLHLDLAAGLPLAQADRGQIQQVFINIVINAAEAIGSNTGTIHVRTDCRALDEAGLRNVIGAELHPGRFVSFEVMDSGCGMDEGTKAKIFEPFFTTKFLGRGLGLAAVAGILRSHGGGIQVDSQPGVGSRFTVLLPATDATIDVAVVPESGELVESGTILVVDDEEIVLEMTQTALARRGYTVLTAASGPAAVELFRSQSARVDLVILDLSMPQMSGEEVLPELRRIRGDVRVVVSSGYSQEDAMKHFGHSSVAGFIQKPYTAAELAAEVSRLLGSCSRSPQGSAGRGSRFRASPATLPAAAMDRPVDL